MNNELLASPNKYSTKVKNWLNQIHEIAGDIFVVLTPIIAPVPAALMLFDATKTEYGIAIAAFLCITVEGLGFSVLSVWLRSKEQNYEQGRRLSSVMLAIYLLTTVMLLTGFKFLPSLVNYRTGEGSLANLVQDGATLAFPLLTVVGASVYGISNALARLAEKKEQANEQRRETRKEKQKAKTTSPAERKILVADVLASNPEATVRQISQLTDIPISTVGRMKAELTNGNTNGSV